MKLRFALCLLTLIFVVAAGLPALGAQPTVGPLPQIKPLLPIAEQLNQQIQSIISGTTTANQPPPANANPPPPANANGAAAATTTATVGPPAPGEEVVEPGETFGTKALSVVLGVGNILVEQGAAFAENFADLPQASDWLDRQTNEPVLRDRWRAAGQDLLLSVGIALAGAILFQFILLPVRRHLRRRQPVNLFRRLAVAIGLLLIELLPVILFVGVSLTLLNEHETQKLPRFVVLNVIYAITLYRLIRILGGLLLAPKSEGKRLMPVSKEQARYLYRWLGYFSFVSVFGYFLIDVARSVRVPLPAVNAFRSLLVLILVIMTIIAIVQKRAAVAVFLRGHLSAAHKDLSPLQSMRLWFARSWHVLAIAYLVIGYLVTALGVEGGFAILLRGTVLTFFILLVSGLALYNLARHDARFNAKYGQPSFHHIVLRLVARIAVFLTAGTAILAAWGANIPAFLATPFGHRITGSLFSIGVTVVVLTLIYKSVNSAVERHLNRESADDEPAPISARSRTLLPMLRNTAFIVFTLVIGLVVLSEVGVNIGPLLAGAGVIGVAIGFGSQTLVKDFLTGLFIVLEGTIAIGDVVQVGDHKGTVEAMTVRTMRLRDADGAVHIMPFSEVTKIVNMTKDFSYVLTTVGVAYDSDLRRVMEVIKEVGEELRQDPKLRTSIIDPIEIFGVDSLGDYAIKIQSRIRTRPGRQWDVKRAFLLRLKERFDKEKIQIPYPTSTQFTKPLTPVLPPDTGSKN